MQEAFGIVIFAVVGVAVVVAVVAFVGSGKLYEQIGRGGLSIRDGDAPARGTGGGGSGRPEGGDAHEREDEIRQMLTAGNARRRRRGEEELDVEAELRRLTSPAVDPALREEIRQLVIARNERRMRAGREPLDVEAEVARQVRDLGDA